jgi:hypothetical protein
MPAGSNRYGVVLIPSLIPFIDACSVVFPRHRQPFPAYPLIGHGDGKFAFQEDMLSKFFTVANLSRNPSISKQGTVNK